MLRLDQCTTGTVLFRASVCAFTQLKRRIGAPAVHLVRIWPLCYWLGSACVYTNSTGDQSKGVNRLLLAGGAWRLQNLQGVLLGWFNGLVGFID